MKRIYFNHEGHEEHEGKKKEGLLTTENTESTEEVQKAFKRKKSNCGRWIDFKAPFRKGGSTTLSGDEGDLRGIPAKVRA